MQVKEVYLDTCVDLSRGSVGRFVGPYVEAANRLLGMLIRQYEVSIRLLPGTVLAGTVS